MAESLFSSEEQYFLFVVLWWFVTAAIFSAAQSYAFATGVTRGDRYFGMIAATAFVPSLPESLNVSQAYHANVGWAALIVGAAVTVSAFEIARVRAPTMALDPTSATRRTRRLLPMNVAVAAALGFVKFWMAAFVFLGNIH